MGNAANKPQTKVAETKEVKTVKVDDAAELKRRILATVTANENVGVKWKEEWKVVLEEIVNQIEVVRSSLSLIIRFNNVPELQLRFGLFSGWTFPPKFTSYLLHDGRTSSLEMRVRKCLGMNSLPYNLWCEVFQQFYSLPNTSWIRHESYNGVWSILNVKYLDRKVLPQLCLENQVCVLPQHYAPSIFRDIPCDRGWIHLNSVRAKDEYDRDSNDWNYIAVPGFSPDWPAAWNCTMEIRKRIRQHIALVQCRNLFQLLFRHDRQKLYSAEQILSTSSCAFNLASSTVKIQIRVQSSKSNPVDSAEYLNFSQVEIVTPTVVTTPELEKLKTVHTLQESAILFGCIAKINIEYAHLLGQLGWSFPLAEDHYSDPKDLRGCVTTAPAHREMESFCQLISATVKLLGAGENCKDYALPTVLANLVTDYFEFPLPSIDCQGTEWQAKTSPLSAW